MQTLDPQDRKRIALAAVEAVGRAARLPGLDGPGRFSAALELGLARVKAGGPPSVAVAERVAKGSPNCDCEIRVRQLLLGLLGAAIEAAYQALKGAVPPPKARRGR